MTTNLERKLPPCTRCHGKMILDKESGDAACFTCGGVVYAVEPAPPELSRTVSHAGQDLS